jgi:hypothetical protein
LLQQAVQHPLMLSYAMHQHPVIAHAIQQQLLQQLQQLHQQQQFQQQQPGIGQISPQEMSQPFGGGIGGQFGQQHPLLQQLMQHPLLQQALQNPLAAQQLLQQHPLLQQAVQHPLMLSYAMHQHPVIAHAIQQQLLQQLQQLQQQQPGIGQISPQGWSGGMMGQMQPFGVDPYSAWQQQALAAQFRGGIGMGGMQPFQPGQMMGMYGGQPGGQGMQAAGQTGSPTLH